MPMKKSSTQQDAFDVHFDPDMAVTNYHEMDERRIWDLFKRGDRKCFRYLYFLHYDSLYYYGLKISGDEIIVNDSLQDLFSDLWFSKENLGKIRSIKAYLLSAMRRRVLNDLKKKRRKQAVALEFLKRQPDLAFSPEDLLIEKKDELLKRTIITEALNRLPKRQKEVIYLRYYEELSNQEISAIMGINYQSVSNSLQKAFAFLRKDEVVRKVLSHSKDLFILGSLIKMTIT